MSGGVRSTKNNLQKKSASATALRRTSLLHDIACPSRPTKGSPSAPFSLFVSLSNLVNLPRDVGKEKRDSLSESLCRLKAGRCLFRIGAKLNPSSRTIFRRNSSLRHRPFLSDYCGSFLVHNGLNGLSLLNLISHPWPHLACAHTRIPLRVSNPRGARLVV